MKKINFISQKAIDFCDDVRDGTHDSPKHLDSGRLLITSKNIKGKYIDFENASYISEEDFNKINERSKVNINDILYSMIGTIGLVYRVEEEPNYAIKNMGLFKVKNELKSKWLYYYLNTPDMINLVTSKLNGSTQKFISLGNLRSLDIKYPENEIDAQKIIKILESIDSKIKLNNKINNNLYELMKVKFNNYVDNIEEYEESVLSKIANYKNGLAMQKFRPINEIGLPVIKIKEMNSGISSETERCRSDIDEEVIINDGDVLFAWSGTLCMSIWCEGKAGLNQHIFKVTSDKYPKWFYYFWTLKHLDNFIEIAAGKATTMGHIKRTELDKAVVKIPNDKSIDEMDKAFTPLLNKYINNNIENRNLAKLRDTLLPKLMNGEIDLDNIEI